MEVFNKPVFLFLIFFVVLVNIATFSDSRATISGNRDPKRVDSHEPRVITIADLTHVNPVEHHRGSSGGFRGAKMGKDDHDGARFYNGLTQGSYGGSYGYGYDNPDPGNIFGFPRGLFGFPRGLFGFPRGLFGFPGGLFGFPRGIFGFPGGYGGNPGVYGVNPGGYGGYPGGYDGGRDGGKPGGGGYEAKVKGK